MKRKIKLRAHHIASIGSYLLFKNKEGGLEDLKIVYNNFYTKECFEHTTSTMEKILNNEIKKIKIVDHFDYICCKCPNTKFCKENEINMKFGDKLASIIKEKNIFNSFQ